MRISDLELATDPSSLKLRRACPHGPGVAYSYAAAGIHRRIAKIYPQITQITQIKFKA